jgi:hypothetical protein
MLSRSRTRSGPLGERVLHVAEARNLTSDIYFHIR